jgi:prophage tail gpP-like protein
MAFNQREVCVLTVDGKLYTEWKSITVYLCQKEAFNYYRFTCSEFTPFAKAFAAQQIRPGAHCTVTLGGEYAIGGRVTTRQVAFTEKSHGVEITGKSYTYSTVNGAATIKGGEMKDKTYPEIASALLKPYGLQFQPKPGINMEPFPRVNVTGQTTFEAMQTLANQRSIVLGVDPMKGDAFWGTAPGYSEGQGQVEEGVNMLEGRETLSMEFGSGPFLTLGQDAPTPQKWGHPTTSAPLGNMGSGFAQSMGAGTDMFMPIVSMAEMPAQQSGASQRSGSENGAINGEQIKVEAVLQGWFNGGGPRGGRTSGVLWRPWNQVHVKSPMLIMNESLICKSVTFTQDDKSGTRTTLELENELGQKGPSLK